MSKEYEERKEQGTDILRMIILIIALILVTASILQSQNLIQNGSSWYDDNNDGMGDGWNKGALTTTANTNGGYQYVYANAGGCSQASIHQVLNITNPVPKRYLITFDLQSCTDVWVIINYNPNVGNLLKRVDFTDAGWASYSVEYDQKYTSCWNIYSLQFCCPNGGENWLMVDNVTMTEIVPVGITERPQAAIPVRKGIYTLLNQKLKYEPDHGFYVKDGIKYYKH